LAAPYWQPEFRSRFVGSGDTPSRIVAVVESIGFLLHANLRRMQEHGLEFTRLRVSGGLSQLDGLCQRLASLSGLPVERHRLYEATAMGLARLAGGLTEMQPIAYERFGPRTDPALRTREQRWQRAMQVTLQGPKKKKAR
jgi:glycerol kinase